MDVLHLTIWSCCIIGLTNANQTLPPSFSDQDFEVQKDQPTFASCNTTGSGKTEIYWTKPGGQRVEEDAGSNVYSTHGNKQLLLVIQEANETHEGEYTCWEVNDEGKTTLLERFTFSVLSKSPPTFELTYAEIEVYEGKNVTLLCTALGDLPMKYSWLDKHSRPITDSTPSAVIYKRGNSSELRLLFVSKEMSGVYTCVATNHLGTSSRLFRVAVNDTPEHENGGYLTVAVLNATDTSVTFAIAIFGISGVESVVVRYKLTNKQDFSTMDLLVGQDYTVSDLLPGAKYDFEFKLPSSSNWTQPIRVALLPPPPEIIVRQVFPRVVKMEFFRPSYLFSYGTIDHYIIKYRTVQMVGGNTWSYSKCVVTINLPSCSASPYEISNLASNVYYSITVQAGGPSGYSRESEMKIFL